MLIDYAVPAVFAAFIWWFSTGLVFLMVGLPRRRAGAVMVGSTAMAALALGGLAWSAQATGPMDAYAAFLCTLLIWAWHELSFLLGYLTGPNQRACPPGLSFPRRFLLAAGTLIHHELAILFTAGLMVAVTWDSPNQVGLWTYLVLWIMRLSAKLNLFLGVANRAEEALPAHLAYLASYFGRGRVNFLFPVAVSLSMLVAGLLTLAGIEATDPFLRTAFILVASLLALAVLEHWLMVLPLPSTAPWTWALRNRAEDGVPMGGALPAPVVHQARAARMGKA